MVLFGGTFDPVHRAHVSAARAVSKVLGGATVHLLPNAVPPHKPQPVANGEDRLAMLRLACQRYPELVADDWELRQQGPSFSLNTLQYFRQQLGERPLVFMIGADSFADLDRWHRWQEYPALCHLAVVPRPGCALPCAEVQAAFPESEAEALLLQPAGLRIMLKRPFLDVSATAIRQALEQKGDCPALDPAVSAHIRRHHLYNAATTTPSTNHEAP